MLLKRDSVLQNIPLSKRNSKLKMKASLEILNIICQPQEPTSVGHRHDKKTELDG
jgi:hypothetical protein